MDPQIRDTQYIHTQIHIYTRRRRKSTACCVHDVKLLRLGRSMQCSLENVFLQFQRKTSHNCSLQYMILKDSERWEKVTQEILFFDIHFCSVHFSLSYTQFCTRPHHLLDQTTNKSNNHQTAKVFQPQMKYDKSSCLVLI